MDKKNPKKEDTIGDEYFPSELTIGLISSGFIRPEKEIEKPKKEKNPLILR